MPTKTRELNMDLLRITCSFLIVILHFSSSYWTCVPIDSTSFITMTVYNSISRISVPIFLMLSGYFLLTTSSDNFSIKSYLRRPLLLLTSLYMWSAFYAFQGPLVSLIKHKSVSVEQINSSLMRFIQGHYHMWFCFLLIGYYILIPIARKIVSDVKVSTLFIILWIAFAFLIPNIFSWINLPSVIFFFDKFEINLVKGYFGYFILGAYLKNITIRFKPLIYISGIGSLAATIILTIHQSVEKMDYISSWFSPSSPFVLLMSVSFFVLFMNTKFIIKRPGEKVIVRISQYTFFAYMFHIFILEKMNLIGITTVSFNPILSIPLLSLSAFIISIALAFIVDKIPFIGKLILHN